MPKWSRDLQDGEKAWYHDLEAAVRTRGMREKTEDAWEAAFMGPAQSNKEARGANGCSGCRESC